MKVFPVKHQQINEIKSGLQKVTLKAALCWMFGLIKKRDSQTTEQYMCKYNL